MQGSPCPEPEASLADRKHVSSLELSRQPFNRTLETAAISGSAIVFTASADAENLAYAAPTIRER
jgi:hypothetical protein